MHAGGVTIMIYMKRQTFTYLLDTYRALLTYYISRIITHVVV